MKPLVVLVPGPLRNMHIEAVVDGETSARDESLLDRTVRLFRERGAEVNVAASAHDTGCRTCLIRGDVFLSPRCADAILEVDGLRFVGRSVPSSITGGRPEVWAACYDTDNQGAVRKAYESSDGSDWQAYRVISDIPVLVQAIDLANWVEVHDWSERFYDVGDIDRWAKRYSRRVIGGK